MAKEFYSTVEIAQILGVSRQAIFKRIKIGDIKATKVGRNFIISRAELPEILDHELSNKSKDEINAVVKRLLDEYGETLRLLGQE